MGGVFWPLIDASSAWFSSLFCVAAGVIGHNTWHMKGRQKATGWQGRISTAFNSPKIKLMSISRTADFFPQHPSALPIRIRGEVTTHFLLEETLLLGKSLPPIPWRLWGFQVLRASTWTMTESDSPGIFTARVARSLTRIFRSPVAVLLAQCATWLYCTFSPLKCSVFTFFSFAYSIVSSITRKWLIGLMTIGRHKMTGR